MRTIKRNLKHKLELDSLGKSNLSLTASKIPVHTIHAPPTLPSAHTYTGTHAHIHVHTQSHRGAHMRAHTCTHTYTCTHYTLTTL